MKPYLGMSCVDQANWAKWTKTDKIILELYLITWTALAVSKLYSNCKIAANFFLSPFLLEISPVLRWKNAILNKITILHESLYSVEHHKFYLLYIF